jgi:hypothetical protein
MCKPKKISLLVASLLLLALFHLPARAQVLPGKHPGYLHSLTNLHTARWLLSHQPGDAKVYAGEDVAIREVDEAVHDIAAAASDDGKSLGDHPKVDLHDHGSRLNRAIESLKAARTDISGEEDDPQVHALRQRSLNHIDKAIEGATHAHDDWLKDNKH